jgi:hypothetical protein
MNSSPFQALTALLVLMVITPSANCLKPTPWSHLPRRARPAQNFAFSVIGAELQQGTIAIAASGNITNIPSDGGQLGSAQDSLNLFFTIAFTLELLLNLYAKWLAPFLADGWCSARRSTAQQRHNTLQRCRNMMGETQCQHCGSTS